MPKIEKAERREKKKTRERHGMRESGRSNFISKAMILRRAEKAAKQKARELDEQDDA